MKTNRELVLVREVGKQHQMDFGMRTFSPCCAKAQGKPVNTWGLFDKSRLECWALPIDGDIRQQTTHMSGQRYNNSSSRAFLLGAASASLVQAVFLSSKVTGDIHVGQHLV